jgi:nucleotidyltransferase substrate binding protein (TIGR01987 family)
MESDNTLKTRTTDFVSVLQTFEQALQLDLTKYKDIELDILKSGQIQKFEYSAELCWKTIKIFLDVEHGLNTVSPKSAIKEFFRIELITEQEYELLNQMLDDRNRLSHIYNALFVNEIYVKLNDYLTLMKRVLSKIK